MLGAAGALIISRAGSMSMAIGGQVVAGFCFGSQPLAYAIASEIVPRKWRPEAQAILSFASAAGALFALLVGGKIAGTSLGGWRIFYYILGGVNAFASVVCILFYNPLPLPLQTSLTSRQKLAMVGTFTLSYILLANLPIARLDWVYTFRATSCVDFPWIVLV